MLKWNKKYLKKTLLPTEVYTSFDYGLSSTVVCSMSVPENEAQLPNLYSKDFFQNQSKVSALSLVVDTL